MDEVVLLNRGQLGQVDMVEEELDVFVIEKEIRHGETPVLLSRKRLGTSLPLPLSTIHYPLLHYLAFSLIALIIIGITCL